MSDITIKTREPKETLPLIQDAVELEKRLIKDSIGKTEAKINDIVSATGTNLKDFEEGKIEYTEENDDTLLELEGELEILKRLRIRLERLNNLEICA